MPRTSPKTPAPASPAARGLFKIEAQLAAEVCQRYEPGAGAAKLLEPGINPEGFLERLADNELFEDALTFIAYALPKREAIWWGLCCVRELTPQEPPAPIASALAAVQAWVDQPDEERRRAAMPAAETATFGTPAGCAALAVFFSGGSMAPPDCPKVPPDEKLTARTIAAAVVLGILTAEPDKADEHARAFVARGIEVASESAPWDAPK